MPGVSLFPAVSVTEAQQLARVIAEKNAGRKMRRLDIFQELKKQPDSGTSRTLVTASTGYGLTKGGYKADYLELDELGRRFAVNGDKSALVDAVLHVEIFKKFFETYKNAQVPAPVAAKSFLADGGIPAERTDACLDVLMENGRSTGLISNISGSERVLTRDHALERVGVSPETGTGNGTEARTDAPLGEPRPPMKRLPSLNINLEVHLPSDQSPEVYDAIFSSMRKHLIDVG
jgi:hypothetical protein